MSQTIDDVSDRQRAAMPRLLRAKSRKGVTDEDESSVVSGVVTVAESSQCVASEIACVAGLSVTVQQMVWR